MENSVPPPAATISLVLTSGLATPANQALRTKWVGLLPWQWFPDDDRHYLGHLHLCLPLSLRAVETWKGLSSAENKPSA